MPNIFVNRDGRRFSGTQKDFCEHVGLSFAAGTRVVRYKSVTRSGWRLSTTQDRLFHAPRSPDAVSSGAVHRLVSADGVVLEGLRQQLAKHFGVKITSMSAVLTGLKLGRLAHYKGYTLPVAPKPA